MRRMAARWVLVCLGANLTAGCAVRDIGKSGAALEVEQRRLASSPSAYSRGAVAADHPLASWAGAEMLRRGGNAVDAAVAASFALSVVRPESCGIGGGGFMLIHLVDDPRTIAPGDKITLAIDYRERAPAMVGPDHFENLPDDASTLTGHAVAVPATVHGLLTALETFGTLDRASVLAPAVRIAREGVISDAHHQKCITTMLAELDARHDQSASARWLRATYADQQRITNAAQARAFEMIAREGREALQTGQIARAIVETVRAHGGVLTMEDMARYEPKIVEPLWGEFRGRRVAVMPLPSSGGITTLEILGLIERRLPEVEAMGPASPAYAHLLGECMKHAFSDRAEYLGDPEFDAIPVRRLLDPAYLDARAASIDLSRTFPPEWYVQVGARAMRDDGGTSHLCAVDRWGNAVSCTETINLEFGSKIAVAEFGFCLNNEMDDFQTKRWGANAFGLVQSDRNLPAPGKRPLSSMSPTIVFDESGEVEIVLGASGGPRIISATTQGILNVLVWSQTASQANRQKRIHHQWMPDVLYAEDPPSDGAWDEHLRGLGHVVQAREIGHMQLIRRAPDEGGKPAWHAASDARKGGRPDGH